MVDQSALGCPLHLYICSEQKNALLPTDLQGLISNWSLASFGLHGLTEPADVTCLHIDRFDSRGKKNRTRLSWDSKVWMPFFFNNKLGIDHIPFVVTAVSYHLGSEPTCGHYCTAVLAGGFWWVFDDGSVPEKFDRIPTVIQENCCLLWLNCTPHGGAEPVSNLTEEFPILSEEEKLAHIIHDPSINDDWHHKWLQAIDRLDADILVAHPGLCHRLVKKCIICQSWPRDMNAHLEVAHRALWEASLPMADKCGAAFNAKAHPTRWCAWQPYHTTELSEDHPCPCLRQFGILHLALRKSQPMSARTNLARLLDLTFS